MTCKAYYINVLIILLSIVFTACSDDDKGPVCLETNITMKINGESQSFEASGYGIILTQNGYILDIHSGRYSNTPYSEQSFSILLPYKKTGVNVIEQFIYHQYMDNISFDGDFMNGEFESNVITNNKSCFYATFSGKLNDGNQEVIITEGKLSYKYENPFDQ